MKIGEILFYLWSFLTIGAAVAAVTLRNLYHCALTFAAALFGVAGIFLYLGSEFLAVVQVLIYVGAVTVLLIFGIMLTRNVMEKRQAVFNALLWPALGVSLFLFAFLSYSAWVWKGASQARGGEGLLSDVYLLGPVLLRPEKGFVFAFELVSVLLLSALVGAIVIARKEEN